jgi:hypothetical protein
MQIKRGLTGWRVGQRVTRKNRDELSTVAKVNQGGTVKVKWDNGRTSYYRPDAQGNVKLAEPDQQQ